jgi:hypothetical protein
MPEQIKNSQIVEETPKIGWPIYLKGFVIFIVLSWVPFYGYMYLNARLAGIGYQSVFITIDVWEAVYYFFISATDFFENTYLSLEYALYSMKMAGLIFIGLLLGTCKCLTSDRVKGFVKEGATWVSKVLKNNFIFSFVAAFFSFILLYLTPAIITAIFSLIFLFSVLGHFYGIKDGKAVLNEIKCIYAKPNSSCVQLIVDGQPKRGHVDYTNDKHTFFISNDGIYYLGAKGQMKQYRPFTLELDIKVNSKEKFNLKEWQKNVSSRIEMLEGFWNARPSHVTGEYVLKQLGKSDVAFHYDEFPAYKLSVKTDCKVAFPFDWVSNEVVNVVFSGNCKGVI